MRDLPACSGITVGFLQNTDNLLLIVVAIGSGLMLAADAIQRLRAGGTVNTTEAVQLMNQKHAVLIDIRLRNSPRAIFPRHATCPLLK